MKRGSALLVVLGMLAFMLFSGLAFSVYMRQSRLPTSFLRRTATTRQLTKAALAEAIDHIDRAIGNDPHPGVHISANDTEKFDEDRIYNLWHHRVFFGTGVQKTPANSSEPSITVKDDVVCPNSVSAIETVPTLTLEGLAYLPPNLINEARYYSQRTPTAEWHSFWFDSGRYAYTAIDVSDYFDVNRLQANKPRAATAAQRISFAHIFEEGEEHTSAGNGAAQWDSFMEGFRTIDDETGEITYKGSQCPFVSMADFNIAWGKEERGGLKCPFYDFIKNPQTGPYNCTQAKENAAAEKYRGMTFVTDGWFPTTAGNKLIPGTTREKIDLWANQPFDDGKLNNSSSPQLIDAMSFGSLPVDERLGHHLCRLGRAQLWDYLDKNRTPVSLAIPTLERVPMIVGVEPASLPTIEFKTTPQDDPNHPSGSATPGWATRTAKRTYTCVMTVGGAVGVRVLAAYPFRKHGIEDSDSFSLDGRVEVFLTVDGQDMKLRSKAKDTLNMTQEEMKKDSNADRKTAFSLKLSFPQKISGETFYANEAEPVKAFGLTGDAQSVGEVTFFKITYQWDQTEEVNSSGDPTGNPTAETKEPTFTDVRQILENETAASFFALTKDGDKAEEFNKVSTFVQKMAGGGIKVKANAAVWVRVKDKDEKTVDLVPACLADDKAFGVAKDDSAVASLSSVLGRAYPLIRYDVQLNNQSDLLVTYDLNSQCPLTVANPKAVVSDPRFNHMPENWRTIAGSGLEEQDWIGETANLLGKAEHDADIFMFTSDAGRLQSVYELAFLPRFTSLDYASSPDIQGSYYPDFSDRSLADPVAQKNLDFMWNTYRCYDSIAGVADPFEEIGLTCGENGPKVNPYSDSKKVLMAAFANTPHDWRLTTTDEDFIPKGVESDMKDAASFNKKHAWNGNENNDIKNGKIRWVCLEEFAEEFQAKVRDSEVQTAAKAANMELWDYAFSDLDWSSDKRKILDSMASLKDDEDSDLYSVDKKFLYGFWHDSFAARQQLFLIFVRAEPMMMGGGVKGQIPPQLGARAVALVWRDPTATTGTRTVDGQTLANPHRTRILFYHQFD